MPLPRLRLEHLEDRATPAAFTVTTLDDAGAGSLRDAIAQANALPDEDTIDFAPSLAGGTIGLSTFTNTGVGDATGPTALIITNPLTIAGSGQTITRVADVFRLFHIESTATVTLSRLTLSNGSARGFAGGGGSAGLGGAIYNRGTLTIDQCTLTGNEALGGPGGANGGGGGMAADAVWWGGAPNGGSPGANGSDGSPGGFGGGGGRGGNGGGGISGIGGNGGDGGAGGFGGGGANGGFGGLGSLTNGIGGRGGNGGFGGGGGAGAGGGLNQGSGGNGGPGGFGGAGTRGSGTFDHGDGGGGAGMGGAVFNQGGTIVIRNSTLALNAARGGNANASGQSGGGYGGALFNLNGSVTLANVTAARNVVSSGAAGAAHGSGGGAVYNVSADVGAVTATQTATLTLINSILAESTGEADLTNHQLAGTARVDATAPNLMSGGPENVGGTVEGNAFLYNLSAGLGPLRDNGGPTHTLLPDFFSLALNNGSNAAAAGPEDQRGQVRIRYGALDLGAVEAELPVVVSPAFIPNGNVGTPYSLPLNTYGPPGPFTFAVTAGTLPAGLSLDSDGVLSGTPTTVGQSTFTVTATNAAGDAGSGTYTVSIFTPVPPPPVLAVGGGNGLVHLYAPTPGGPYGPTPAATLTPFAGFAGAVRVAVADVNGDGAADLIAATGPGTPLRVTVISGTDNTTVLVPPFDPFGGDFPGGGLVSAADIDRDGRSEFLITPDEGGGPRVSIYTRNADGTTARKANFLGIDDPNFRGGARAALGDVNRDGTPDLAVSAGFLGGPRTALFNGTTLFATPTRLINDFFAFPGADATTLRNGVFVASGDLDGDGFSDLIFGGGPGGAPRVFILSGAKVAAGDVAGAQAAPIGNFFVAGNTTDRGGVRVAVKHAEGLAALVAGSGEGSPSKVRVYKETFAAGPGEPSAFQDLDPFGTTLPGGVFVG